ncbi:hypothetical protein [Saccharothrix deserti]|uniref:hypothetical protein n=1 Tax=Saccharothrix deserti TaxID=2593674 RepID=UPI00131D2F35|nr:hypothetical protein [Saccharothrix deserti]
MEPNTSPRPSLWQAIQAKGEADQAAADETARPEREAYEAALAADAALYGTAGWEALPTPRRAQVAAWARQQGAESAA